MRARRHLMGATNSTSRSRCGSRGGVAHARTQSPLPAQLAETAQARAAGTAASLACPAAVPRQSPRSARPRLDREARAAALQESWLGINRFRPRSATWRQLAHRSAREVRRQAAAATSDRQHGGSSCLVSDSGGAHDAEGGACRAHLPHASLTFYSSSSLRRHRVRAAAWQRQPNTVAPPRCRLSASWASCPRCSCTACCRSAL